MNEKHVAALVLALAGSVIFGTENFKDDFSGKIWGTWKAKGMIATGSKDKETGRTAPGALKITVGPDCPLNKSMCFLRHLPITPGKSYTASVWYKTNGTDPSVRVSMNFQGQNEKGGFLNNGLYGTHKSAAGEWTRLVYTISIPAKGKKWEQAKMLLCTLSVSGSAKGEVWFDDFEFQVDEDNADE